MLPIIFGSPDFVERADASGEPPVTRDDLELWRQYVDRLVSRYGPAGSFWTETSDVQFNPITDWQVWNEPNLRMFWTDEAPNAKEYAEFLDFTRRAVRSVDAGARIVLAGMPQRADAPKAMADFLEKLYEVKGFARDFDAVAVHPFVPVDATGCARRRRWRRSARSLKDNGDAAKIMYLTEVGAASAGPSTPFTTDYEGSAQGPDAAVRRGPGDREQEQDPQGLLAQVARQRQRATRQAGEQPLADLYGPVQEERQPEIGLEGLRRADRGRSRQRATSVTACAAVSPRSSATKPGMWCCREKCSGRSGGGIRHARATKG